MHLCKSNTCFNTELGTSGSTRSVQNDTTNLGSYFSSLLRTVETSCNWNSYGWRQLHLSDSADERDEESKRNSVRSLARREEALLELREKIICRAFRYKLALWTSPLKKQHFLLLLASCMLFKITFEDTYLRHLLERHRLGITWLSLSLQKRKDFFFKKKKKRQPTERFLSKTVNFLLSE